MIADHVEALKAFRAMQTEARRKLVERAIEAGRKGDAAAAIADFAQLQERIEMIDRAIADEKKAREHDAYTINMREMGRERPMLRRRKMAMAA